MGTYLGFVRFAGVRALAVLRSSVTWQARPVLVVGDVAGASCALCSQRARRRGRAGATYLGWMTRVRGETVVGRDAVVADVVVGGKRRCGNDEPKLSGFGWPRTGGPPRGHIIN